MAKRAKAAKPKRGKTTTVARKRAAPRAVRPPARPARPKIVAGVAPGMQPVNAYLAVRDVTAALDYYQRAFGMKRRFVLPGPDGKPMHAEMGHRESVIMLGPESSHEQASNPDAARMSLYIYVSNVDNVVTQAREAGGQVVDEPADQFWGDRTATVVDPDGHRWTVATCKKIVPPDQMKPPM